MKELVNQFLLGSSIKLIDEISDVPSLTEQYKSYLQPLMFMTVFLYGLDAGNDFYYNLIWIAWFISAYFGQSMDNEIDKGFWQLCFFLVLFALVYSATNPLPNIDVSVFSGFFLLLSVGNILENIFLHEETSLLKILFSFFVTLCVTLFYIYIIPLMKTNSTMDFRYLEKHMFLILGYFITRFLIKVYVYYTDKV